MKKKKGFLDGYDTYDTSEGFGDAESWQEAFRERMSADNAKVILNAANKTPYQVLGIEENAPLHEIKKAFRTLLHQWHEDKNQGNPVQAKEITQELIAAYELLTQKHKQKRN